VRIGEHVLIYPDVHLETQGNACIELGDGLVISRGAHIVAMDGIKIGEGSLIGEYTSIRDANHNREPNQPIRDSGHSAKPITIGREVWLGRGVTVLGGVMIGDKATVGANAVVTRDVPAGTTVVGIPAIPLPPKTA
jgi:acetyltransferase-like isoleucine patch superfamily enzyme